MVQQANAHNNELLGKELKYFSQAGFDLDRIHIKVSCPIPRLIARHCLICRAGDDGGT